MSSLRLDVSQSASLPMYNLPEMRPANRAFWDAGLVDRVQMYMTPHRLGMGGQEWLPLPLRGLGPITRKLLGADILIEGYVHRAD